METDQNKMSKDSIAHPHKPIDFTVRSQNGLGQLKRFPREIRNIIYSSIIPQLMVHGPEQITIDRCIVRELVNAPILATSKQLCVEFLEIFVRVVNLEESDEHHYDKEYRSRRPDCLEKPLAFINPRIETRFDSNKSLGLKMDVLYFVIEATGLIAPYENMQTKELRSRLLRLWDIHENFRVPSNKIHLNIDYHEPRLWIEIAVEHIKPLPKALQDLPETFWSHEFENASAKVTLSDESASVQAMADMETKMRHQMLVYKDSKLRKFRALCASERDRQFMEEAVEWILAELDQYPFSGISRLHLRMSKMAINFWKAKEEQYSVWHLFDLAESWLEVKNA
ncbi:hypothetical protein KCU95_g6581, partial [Aureobasidium melanogenum]